MSFFESYAFYFLVGLFIGTMLGFFIAVILCASSRASRDEERMLDGMKRENKG